MKALTCLFVSIMTLAANSAQATPPSAVDDFVVGTGRSTAAGGFTVPAGATYYQVKYWDGTMNEPGWGGYFFGSDDDCTEYESVCFDFDNVEDCHLFVYAVRVYGPGGWSDLSNQISLMTKCAPSTEVVECP